MTFTGGVDVVGMSEAGLQPCEWEVGAKRSDMFQAGLGRAESGEDVSPSFASTKGAPEPEEMMMDREASVSALVFHRPDCAYIIAEEADWAALEVSNGCQELFHRAEPDQRDAAGNEGEIGAVSGEQSRTDSEGAGSNQDVVGHAAPFVSLQPVLRSQQAQDGAGLQAKVVIGCDDSTGHLERAQELFQDSNLTGSPAACPEFHGDHRAHADLGAVNGCSQGVAEIRIPEVIDQDIGIEDEFQNTFSIRGIFPAETRKAFLISSRTTTSSRALVTASVSVLVR